MHSRFGFRRVCQGIEVEMHFPQPTTTDVVGSFAYRKKISYHRLSAQHNVGTKFNEMSWIISAGPRIVGFKPNICVKQSLILHAFRR